MLKQLAGPFPLLDDTGAPITSPISSFPTLWYPGRGLFCLSFNPVLGGYISSMSNDGWVIRMTQTGAFAGININSWIWDDFRQVLIVNGFDREPLICAASPTPASLLTIESSQNVSALYLLDRSLQLIQGQLVARYPNARGREIEAYLPLGGGYSGNIGPGRGGGDFFISEAGGGPNARGLFYDTIGKSISLIINLGMAALGMAYAPEYNAIFSTHTDGLRIWSLDVQPDHLSAVTLKQGSTSQNGIGVYQVSVLGAHGDWAAGVLVDWTLTGQGTVLDTQSTTDIHGVATCRVLYPEGSTGNATPTASVTC